MINKTDGSYSGIATSAFALSFGLGSIDFKKFYAGLLSPFKAIKALFGGDAKKVHSTPLKERAHIETHSPQLPPDSNSKGMVERPPAANPNAAFNHALNARIGDAKTEIEGHSIRKSFIATCEKEPVKIYFAPGCLKDGSLHTYEVVRAGKNGSAGSINCTYRLPEGRGFSSNETETVSRNLTSHRNSINVGADIHEKVLHSADEDLNALIQTLFSSDLTEISRVDSQAIVKRTLTVQSKERVTLTIHTADGKTTINLRKVIGENGIGEWQKEHARVLSLQAPKLTVSL